jgi:hypothetical protein
MPLGQGMTDMEKILLNILNCLKEQCYNDSAALRIDSVTSGSPQVKESYIGYAPAGTDPAATGWIIQKVIVDNVGGANEQTVRSWAESSAGATDYLVANKIWNNRATYTYAFDTP